MKLRPSRNPLQSRTTSIADHLVFTRARKSPRAPYSGSAHIPVCEANVASEGSRPLAESKEERRREHVQCCVWSTAEGPIEKYAVLEKRVACDEVLLSPRARNKKKGPTEFINQSVIDDASLLREALRAASLLDAEQHHRTVRHSAPSHGGT